MSLRPDDSLRLSCTGLSFPCVKIGVPPVLSRNLTSNGIASVDISDNKVLVNVSVNGTIEYLSVFRGSYEVVSLLPGVW